MKCPEDQATLLITERSGVEIDYCPDCRGVWLNKGELDRIIEKNATFENPVARSSQNTVEQPRKKKRESFLSDLFDF